MARDFYTALDVSPHASPEEIKTAYRRLVREYHPDAAKGAEATERFREIQEAYDTLSDPKRKLQYDTQRRQVGVRTYRQNQAAADIQKPKTAPAVQPHNLRLPAR